MLYTFLGVAVGIIAPYVYCEAKNVSHLRRIYGLSDTESVLVLGVLICGGIGLIIE